LTTLLADSNVLKIVHFARFDLGVIQQALGVMPAPVYCTKVASRLARTYTDKHGLKDLVKEVLGVDLSKQQQLSDWGASELPDAPPLRRFTVRPCHPKCPAVRVANGVPNPLQKLVPRGGHIFADYRR